MPRYKLGPKGLKVQVEPGQLVLYKYLAARIGQRVTAAEMMEATGLAWNSVRVALHRIRSYTDITLSCERTWIPKRTLPVQTKE